jgi:hypothetical protein
MRARVDDPPQGLPFVCSAESLRGMRLANLRTPAGDLHLTFTPVGFPDVCAGLVPGAQAHTIGGITVKVAGLDDVIKSKTAAARPKDLGALPELLRPARGRAGDMARLADVVAICGTADAPGDSRRKGFSVPRAGLAAVFGRTSSSARRRSGRGG